MLRQFNKVSGPLISKLENSFVPLCVAGTQLNQVRYKKPDLRYHRHAYWERMQLLEFTKPSFDTQHETTEDLWQECPREEELKEIHEIKYKANELESLYAAQMREYFESFFVLAVFFG